MSDLVKVNPLTDAIVHVDIQTAFMETHNVGGYKCSGGGLPVPGGHEVVMEAFLNSKNFFPDHRRYASLDMHPIGHISFASSHPGFTPYQELTLEAAQEMNSHFGPYDCGDFNTADIQRYLKNVPGEKQTLWPDHAVIGTAETILHPVMAELKYREILPKGLDRFCDSYSAVADNMGRSTGLAERMQADGVRRVFLDGLAYTHCVGWSALGFASRGFEVFVIKDATRSVPIPGLEEAMDDQLAKAGVHIIQSAQLSR